MNILIVDDEMMIKEWLKLTIASLPFQIERLEVASNGEEALLKVGQYKFDLILVDVMMPKMNGLEFLKRINEIDTDAMLIVLSSHDEFKFAKEAIKYNVSEYILKNECSKEKLIEILQECEDRLEQSNVSSRMNEDVLLRAIKGNKNPHGEALIKGLFPSVGQSLLFVGMCKDCDNSLIKKFQQDDVIIHMVGIVGRIEEGLFILFSAESEKGDKNFNKEKQIFANYVASNSGGKVSLSRSFFGTQHVLSECRNCWIGYQSLFYEKYISVSGPAYYKEFDAPSVDELCDRTLSAIRSYDEEKTTSSLRALNDYFHKEKPTDVERVIQIYISVLSTFIIYNNKKSSRLTEKLESFRSTILGYESFDDLATWVINIVEKNAELMSRNRFSPAVEKSLEYIEEHYQTIKSVAEIADYVNLSLDYFSRHFKKEVGVPLNSYLINFRLDKASVILLSSNLSVQEVAKKVGVESGSYFSKCFKKKFHTQPIRFKIQTKD